MLLSLPFEPMIEAIVEAGALTTIETCVRMVTRETLTRNRRPTTGLSDANRLRLPFSSSFLESALRWNVVWRVFWLVEASILIL